MALLSDLAQRAILMAHRGLTALFDFTKFNQSEQTGIVRHNSKNAFNPVLLLCAITTPSFLFAAYMFKDDVTTSRLLLICAVLPVVTACATYIYLAFAKPERLQSESFQLRQQAMQLVAQKGRGFTVTPVSLEAISNPSTGTLEAGEEAK